MKQEQDKNQNTDEQVAWERNWEKVQGVDTGSVDGLMSLNVLATDIFFDDHAFSKYHEILGKEAGDNEKVRKAVGTYTYPEEDSVNREEYRALLQATHVKEEIARKYILRHIEIGSTFGLEEWELQVLGASCRVAGAFDEMCGIWREDVQHNPLNEKAIALGLNNQYTVPKDVDGEIVEVSFADAFSDQIAVITEELDHLADVIDDEVDPESEKSAMANYFRSYTSALGSNDLDNLPEMWRDVDRAWMSVRGRLQPIASREYDYLDPKGVRIFPDFRLTLVNMESNLSQSVEATRIAMVTHLGYRFDGVGIYDETKMAMDTIAVFPTCNDIVNAGSLDSQPSGQSLPNEESVMRELGVKVFLNPDISALKWNLALDLARKGFPSDHSLFDNIDDGFHGIGIDLAGHEIGEPLLDTDGVRKGLGGDIVRLLNEDAAQLSITSIMPERVVSGELSRDDLDAVALKLLGTYLRYIDIARGHQQHEPYYRGMALLGLKRMIECEFLKFDHEDELRIDLSQIDGLYELSKRDFREQVKIADSVDKDRAVDYLSTIINEESVAQTEEIPEIAYLIDAIKPNSRRDV